MSKDKKKKTGKKSEKASATLRSLAQSPLVADIVAAALVATASALKDSKRARALAADAADELGKLSKKNAERGNALWDMALQIGRRSLETLVADERPKRTSAKRAAKKSGVKKTSKKRPAPRAAKR